MAEDIVWETSFKKALEKAKKANKLVLASFFDSGCEACCKIRSPAFNPPLTMAESNNIDLTPGPPGESSHVPQTPFCPIAVVCSVLN
jgi:hypothetical protein